MEVVFAIPLLFLPLVMPLIAGLMARGFGRKFWPWFVVGIVLPFVANIILLCLPDKSKKQIAGLRAIKTETDQLFINNNSEQEVDDHNHLPATA
jgi:MFS family permease